MCDAYVTGFVIMDAIAAGAEIAGYRPGAAELIVSVPFAVLAAAVSLVAMPTI